jgi:hypothetical protein
MSHKLLIGLALCAASGCVQVEPPGNGGGEPATITVRWINATASALDPQFYSSPEPLGDPAVMLFVPQYQVLDGVGFAGSGLIPGGQFDEVVIDCETVATIGTLGGEFRNPDTGEPSGTGQQRILSAPLNFVCGDTIVFTYRSGPEGFRTLFTVE